MTTTKRRVGSRPGLTDDANALITAIRADGRYDHVTVRADRGFLYVEVDEQPVVRLEPLSRDHYGLSFHRHTGRWEPTPFTGGVGRLADVITTVFAPHLESYDFPPTKSGPSH
jgi:hypothetical protein